jgi:ABC-type dipeptide/oligopeptide/nickel transport system ATPase component
MEVLLKKIDLHIHTVPTISDSQFIFSLDEFKRYVAEANLDAVAVTNHDVFDGAQFRALKEALDVTVFPGIEVNLENGHLLIISDWSNLEDFEARTNLISQKITKIGDSISVEVLEKILGDLKNYLIIPHYDKAPAITGETLEKIKPYISAGEVDSAKKFIRATRDDTKLTPVLFSDVRISNDLAKLPTRQTFIDCGDLTLDAIKSCLRDKAKVTLSENDGNKLWQVFEDGQKLSTGLNVLLGERSSGKTYTLNKISSIVENVKYIKQFSLVQQDEASYEREFKTDVQRKRSSFVDEYLSGLKNVLDNIMNVDLVANDRQIEQYIATLLKSAEDADRRDAFSKTALFDEVDFPVGQIQTLSELIESVRQVIENIEFKSIIEKHLDLESLKRLACELIELLWRKALENKKKKLVNELVKEVKQRLKLRTSAVQVEDVDLYRVSMDRKRVERFTEIVDFLKREAVVSAESVQGFRVEAKKGPFGGAGEIKEASGVRTVFSDAFKEYGDPYKYLRALLSIENLKRSELYKLFVKIGYSILNRDGFEVSGGERSEFRLLQEIMDAQNYDVLLIDEPESSFDNLFLKSDVNQILKEISESMPVVVVTHNSTVGGSAGADYLLYARKELEDGKIFYKLYSGYPMDKKLFSMDGKSTGSHETVMDSLEAGLDAYDSRRQGYEAIKH